MEVVGNAGPFEVFVGLFSISMDELMSDSTHCLLICLDIDESLNYVHFVAWIVL